MNQLINSLVDATAALVPGVYTVEYESGKKGVEFTEEALNKFAELIVRECAKRSEELGNTELGQGLRKHFGVDE